MWYTGEQCICVWSHELHGQSVQWNSSTNSSSSTPLQVHPSVSLLSLVQSLVLLLFCCYFTHCNTVWYIHVWYMCIPSFISLLLLSSGVCCGACAQFYRVVLSSVPGGASLCALICLGLLVIFIYRRSRQIRGTCSCTCSCIYTRCNTSCIFSVTCSSTVAYFYFYCVSW